MRTPWLLATVFCACGPDGPPDRSYEQPTAAVLEPPPGSTPSVDLAGTYGAPRAAVDAGRAAIAFAGQAVEAATILSGSSEPRTTGTLTEHVDGRVEYEPLPSDRLVVLRGGGRRIELSIRELSGSGENADSFFQGDHRIRVEYLSGAELVGEVWSSRRGSSRSAGIAGDLTLDGATWTTELQLEGTETFDSDNSGSRYFDDHDLVGRIRGDSAQVDVREHWTFELVSASRGLSDNRRGTASSAVRTVESVAEIDGQRIEWRGVQTRTAFRDGKPTELDTFWSGVGEVMADGGLLGRVEKFAMAVGESGGFVGFQVVTPSGNVELERHQAY